MSTDNTNSFDFNRIEQSKNTKKDYTKKLYKLLYNKPLSRRMAATELGFTDQTYMVTQLVSDWIKQGKAMVIGVIKCSRSGRFVQAVTTNADFFPQSNQLKMFGNGE
jgi:Rod binding domain-containing protein